MSRILIAEDDPATAALIQNVLLHAAYQVDLVKNGQEALASYDAAEHSLVITDLNMPEMDGEELIENLKQLEDPPVMIVVTGDDSLQRVVQTMRLGIFDYLPKPVSSETLLMRVRRAMQHAELIQNKLALEHERELRQQRQMDMFRYRQHHFDIEVERREKDLFQKLNANFSNSFGIGALLSTMELLPEFAEETKNGYLIDHELMKLIDLNTKMARRALETIRDIDHLIETEIETETITLQNLYGILENVSESMQDWLGIKNHKLELSNLTKQQFNHCLSLNTELFQESIEELVINAFKFSLANSTVLILLKIQNKQLIVSILDKPSHELNSGKGVTPEFEGLVFEPFFRIERHVDERYQSLNYGLGLTRVQKIIQKHGGNLSLFNVNDMLGANTGKLVSAEISLPLLETAKPFQKI